MDIRKVLEEVMDLVKNRYQNNLVNVYPSWGSNGFVERNQTFNFCSQYLFHSKNPTLSIWQEVPVRKTHGHLDSLIVDGDTAFIIEAKRLQSEKSVESITKDMNRMDDVTSTFMQYKSTGEKKDLMLNGLENVNKVVSIILADYWYPIEPGPSQNDKIATRKLFEDTCKKRGYKTIIEKKVLTGGTKEVSSKEQYSLLCAIKE